MFCESELPQLKPQVTNQQDSLEQLQEDVAALAKYVEKLSQWRKQEVQQTLKSKIVTGLQQLGLLADSINLLADQLEIEILKFKTIAIETNEAYHAIQQSSNTTLTAQTPSNQRPLNIWEVNFSALPVVEKKTGGFLLTARTINLFAPDTQKDIQTLALQQPRKPLLTLVNG
ncbi:MAG: hypothetical protein SAK29_05845 [Scytonema sp. PMC 1069.18]|nr:hypothetical protein [Scytonema sp. PMC 1069.18]MEC4881341.1 hypothetical protein [Scytonema sp. PMC 1070.18]